MGEDKRHMTSGDITDFIQEVEERLDRVRENKIPFSDFLEERMDYFNYSNTSLAKKVFHRASEKKAADRRFVPVTRQAIGSWLRGSMPSSREIYVTLGMAFEMSLEEINHILLESYMGYGLYCKNIDDALWIALINGLFDIEQMDSVKEEVERILTEESTEDNRSLATTDLWVLLADTGSLPEFYRLIRTYRDEFADGARKFGQCLEEVIEEEYGYYEKASWFLRDIGLLHYEAQFSKIRAGKAIVTREWLLRFCIALQPSIESIEKLLAKAQMEPLGITPGEIIIDMVSRYKSDSLANSQEIWILIENVARALMDKGCQIDPELCFKYNSVRELTNAQKWWFSLCLLQRIADNEKNKDYGYEKAGYCRYAYVDRILFDDMNRCKKSALFRNCQKVFEEGGLTREMLSEGSGLISSSSVSRETPPDVIDLEKFSDYCYMRKPNRFTRDFQMNDIYLCSGLLFSIWTGLCFTKEDSEHCHELLSPVFAFAGEAGERLAEMISDNLADDTEYSDSRNLSRLEEAVMAISPA